MSIAEVFQGAVKAVPPEEVERFAERADVSSRQLRRWRGGDVNPTLENIQGVARALGVSPLALLGGRENGAEAVEIAGEEFGVLPLVAPQVAAGSPVVSEAGEVLDRYAFHREFLDRFRSPAGRDRLVLVKVATDHKGESMVPTIQPGALLVIDRGPDAEGWTQVDSGGIYLVRPPDEEGVTVKRLFRSGDQLIIWSDNPAHRPDTISLRGRRLQRIAVGRVRWVAQETV